MNARYPGPSQAQLQGFGAGVGGLFCFVFMGSWEQLAFQKKKQLLSDDTRKVSAENQRQEVT